MRYLQARNYTRVANGRHVDLIVIHTAETPLQDGVAWSVAGYFAGQAPSTKTGSSAHYVVDSGEVVACVQERDVAWHAPGANHNGVGIEHAGYARMGEGDWSGAYCSQMLTRSAQLSAEIAARYQIPLEWLGPADLIAGRRGITGHVEVTYAFHESDHIDPGTTFPRARYVDLVRGLSHGTTTVSFPPPVFTDLGGDDSVNTIDVDVPLDNAGNGWVLLDAPPERVVGLVALGPYPPVDGYGGAWTTPRLSRQDRGGKTCVTVEGGEPLGRVHFTVALA